MLGGLLIFLFSSAMILSSTAAEEENEILYPPFAQAPPNIDGNLDDEIWQQKPIEKDFITYNPLYGEVLPQKTEVWMAYDSQNLYFAFKCYDTEPEKIKTSITKRDNIFSDDWVGLKLDALGNKQTSYDLFSNPNGIQGDILTSAVSGEDVAPDIVWDSAGKVTDDGYQVEMRIPARSIRFKSGKEVKMGILFWRRISRLGLSGSWPDIKPGEGIFNVTSPVIYRNLESPLNLEVLPSVTFGSNRDRINPEEWAKSDTFKEIGFGVKYGITSSITADITANPDFSQVESDAFQVEVNRRYPIFYSEKRPFFMEGVDIFNFFTIPYGYIRTAVHTRRIADPQWGLKLTGTLGKTSFGILSAGDEWPGLPWENGTNPYEGKKAYFAIARGKHSFGGDNYIGALYNGREFAMGYNRVAGADISYRFFNNHQVNASFLKAFTKAPEGGSSTSSLDYNFMYAYFTKPLGIQAAYEHIGKNFTMDSSFLMRSGVNEGWVWVGPSFYPSSKKTPWLKRIGPHITYQYIHDLNTGMDDTFFRTAIEFNFTKQASFYIDYIHRKESWKGQTFDLNEFNLAGGIQLTKWLRLGGELSQGEQIFYNADPSFEGDSWESMFHFSLQPSAKFNQFFSFYHIDFDKDKKDIYDVNITYSRTTYQFNKYFFIRAIVQYNSYQKKMLTDFLASFTFIPGTVLHIGYGGIYEKRRWVDDRWLYQQGSMFNMKRSFFFKASYLWRF